MTAQHGREKAEEFLAVCQDFADDLLASHGEEAVEAFWKKIAKRANRQMQSYADERRRRERLCIGSSLYVNGELFGTIIDNQDGVFRFEAPAEPCCGDDFPPVTITVE